MATARTAETRRLASPTIKALIRQRSAALTGLVLGMLGLALLVALVCYDPRDPSLNTATSRHTANLAGPVGAVLADLLLQGFGVAGALPGLAMLAWAWRIASRRGLGSMAARLAAMLAALPVLAPVLAAIPTPRILAWPTVAGLGGAIGKLLASTGLSVGRDVLGPVGAVMMWTMGLALAVTLTLLALGLTASEWRAAGRIARRTTHFAVGFRLPALGSFPLPRWLHFRRAAGAAVRHQPVAPTRLVPAMDDPVPVVAHTTRPAAQPRRPRQESLPLDAGWRFPPLSPGCWSRCLRTMACRAASWRSVPDRSSRCTNWSRRREFAVHG
jgi:S-DNA-T family DNA segregation ATPase FtsK/SpoIIIE